MKNYRVSESLRSRKSQGRRHNFEGFIYFSERNDIFIFCDSPREDIKRKSHQRVEKQDEASRKG